MNGVFWQAGESGAFFLLLIYNLSSDGGNFMLAEFPEGLSLLGGCGELNGWSSF